MLGISISLTMASFAGRLDPQSVRQFFASSNVGLISVLVSYIVMPVVSQHKYYLISVTISQSAELTGRDREQDNDDSVPTTSGSGQGDSE